MAGSQSNFGEMQESMATLKTPAKDPAEGPDFIGTYGNSSGVIPSLREKYKATLEYDQILARRKNSSFLTNKGQGAKTQIKLKPLLITPHFL
jgi:hypothetical protein